VKRLLLENILLLSNRRVPNNDLYDLDNIEVFPSSNSERSFSFFQQANKILKETYGKCLQKIFDYYLDIANKRRNHALTAEKTAQRDLRASTNRDVAELAAVKTAQVQQMKELAKNQKEFIGYKEYIQFCHDFSLKSTSLLTAIQVGEIFLNVVPLNTEAKSECGMNFELFLRSLLYMAAVAYRDSDPRITQLNKVKGILLYMWKAVNDNEKTMRLVSSNRSNTLSQFAGALNVFGSGQFSDLFLSNWLKDGFIDYSTHIVDDPEKTGSLVKNFIIIIFFDGLFPLVDVKICPD
jgi:hypothetical protein